MAKNPRLIDMTGQSFGHWSVLSKHGNTKRGGALWSCKCRCGAVRAIVGADLRLGKSTSCGCATSQLIGDAARTHGQSGTRLYRIWKGMRSRCTRDSLPGFKDYGGRGITVCAEWASFVVFREWATANGYADTLSIERTDVDRGYCPDNCTWAGADVQSANRRYTQKAESGDLWLHIARANGIKDATFHSRIHKQGWTREKAATAPPR